MEINLFDCRRDFSAEGHKVVQRKDGVSALTYRIRRGKLLDFCNDGCRLAGNDLFFEEVKLTAHFFVLFAAYTITSRAYTLAIQNALNALTTLPLEGGDPVQDETPAEGESTPVEVE